MQIQDRRFFLQALSLSGLAAALPSLAAGKIKPGANAVEIKVTNLWVNRLIGDAQPGAQKITWTPLPTYKADAPLRRSGLIGPVELLVTP